MSGSWVLQTLAVLLAIPIVLLIVYIVVRIISLAVIQSWWDLRLKYAKKLLDLFKDNTQKGEGKNDG